MHYLLSAIFLLEQNIVQTLSEVQHKHSAAIILIIDLENDCDHHPAICSHMLFCVCKHVCTWKTSNKMLFICAKKTPYQSGSWWESCSERKNNKEMRGSVRVQHNSLGENKGARQKSGMQSRARPVGHDHSCTRLYTCSLGAVATHTRGPVQRTWTQLRDGCYLPYGLGSQGVFEVT